MLPKLQTLLSSTPLPPSLLTTVVKSIFYGVWNFDKMINQHALNTRLAEMLTKLPKKNSLAFLREIFRYLHEKWNLIDHHRINKFMQLTRYLLAAGWKQCDRTKMQRGRVDGILMEEVFQEYEGKHGGR